MNDIFKGPVYDFLVNKSINNKNDWGGNGGTLDASTSKHLENSKKGNTFMREFLKSISPKNIIETEQTMVHSVLPVMKAFRF